MTLKQFNLKLCQD